MVNGHSLANPVGPAGPAGIDEPHGDVMPFDPLSEHLCIAPWMQRQERASVAGAECGRRFGHTLFRARHLGRIPIDEVVHRLSAGQFRHRRQHTKCIASQEYDIIRMPATT